MRNINIMQNQIFFMLFLSTITTEVFRREITNSQVKPSSQIFGELLCHTELPLFNREWVEQFDLEVIQNKVLAGVPQENKTYTFEYDVDEEKKM